MVCTREFGMLAYAEVLSQKCEQKHDTFIKWMVLSTKLRLPLAYIVVVEQHSQDNAHSM